MKKDNNSYRAQTRQILCIASYILTLLIISIALSGCTTPAPVRVVTDCRIDESLIKKLTFPDRRGGEVTVGDLADDLRYLRIEIKHDNALKAEMVTQLRACESAANRPAPGLLR